MYMPTLARFTARDPLPPQGEPVLMGGLPEYQYANNSPVNFSDASGQEPRPFNVQAKKKNRCTFRICANNVAGAFSHLYIVIQARDENGKLIEYGFRGGPGKTLKQYGCDKKIGVGGLAFPQLVSTYAPYTKKEFERDYRPPEDETCQEFEVEREGSCLEITDCFKETSDRIDSCCIIYEATGLLPFTPTGNSNSFARWLLSSCLPEFKPPAVFTPKTGKIPLPTAIPGWIQPMPGCVKDEDKGKEDDCPKP